MFRRALGSLLTLSTSTATAEHWVSVFDDDPIWASVDKDTIHRGPDGLVYFQSDGDERADRAADCASRTLYTLKSYAMGGIAYPDWRNKGRIVVPGSAGAAELDYACSNG